MTGSNSDLLFSIESVLGGTGNDTIIGNGVDNTLVGRAGADVINGGAGNDTLTGGAFGGTGDGAGDTFQFDGVFGNDTITDFENGVDFIEINIGGGTAAAVQSGTDTVVTVTNTSSTVVGTITLEDFNVADFDPSDYNLV